MKNPKYIFVWGGYVSWAKVLRPPLSEKYYSPADTTWAIMKADMYVNIDAGTIRPPSTEKFLSGRRLEADQDLGNYERFTNQTSFAQLHDERADLSGVIRRERNLEYGGEVGVYPDIPKEIIRRIEAVTKS